MKIQEFISQNPNWEEILSSPPYSLDIKRENGLVLFKYSQIDSDFSLDIVQESRGLILEEDSKEIVAHPFHKFFNYGEPHAHNIDWDSARVQSKEDGSLIKVYYYNDAWHVATNGTIDAYKAELESEVVLQEKKIVTYGELFDFALDRVLATITGEHTRNDFFSSLDKDYTHLFELCTPWNRIVVPYRTSTLFYLTSKHTQSGQEVQFDLSVPRPREFSFSSFDDLLAMAQTLGYDDEGYVVVDKNQNRIKIKSPAYLAAHRLKGNGVVTYKRVLEMILTGEYGEFLSYFPEYENIFHEVQSFLDAYLSQLNDDLEQAKQKASLPRKDFALWAKEQTNPGFLFAWLDQKVETSQQFVENMRLENLAKILENLRDEVQ